MKTNHLLIVVVLSAILLAGCSSPVRVGELQSDSQSVDLGVAKSVHVKINMGAGNLEVTGGATKLLEADFIYNVAKLKPAVQYGDGTLLVQQPNTHGLPALQGISDFRNDWNLQLYDQVPLNLSVNIGAGNSNLQLANLSLTGLDVVLGAGTSKLDLRGNWDHDMDITINTGAADVTMLLPKDVGVRVKVDRGPTVINASGWNHDGNVYTNSAYGTSDVTLNIDVQAGIGQLNLELADH